MWYVKHPFDCIVVGASADRDGGRPHPIRGPPARLPGSRGPLPAHSHFGIEAASFLQPADVRTEECGKQNTLGGLVLPW